MDASHSAVRLKAARQQLSEFIRSTGGRADSARTGVAGFGRSATGKATWAVRKNALTNSAGQTIIKVGKTGIKGPPNSITQKANAKGGIDRNYYDSRGRQIKQISNNGHGHKKEESLGLHGEHAHNYIWDENERPRRLAARELTDIERKENGDIL